MTRWRGRWTGMAAVVLAVGGCGGIGDNFKDPDLQLNRVVVRGIGLTGGTLDLVMDVHNPNNFQLQGTKLQVGFDVQGAHVGDIQYEDRFGVPSGETTTLTLPVTFQWSGVGSAVRSALEYGDVPYTLKGQATLETPWGRRVVPFTREGRAPLTRSSGTLPASLPGTR